MVPVQHLRNTGILSLGFAVARGKSIDFLFIMVPFK